MEQLLNLELDLKIDSNFQLRGERTLYDLPREYFTADFISEVFRLCNSESKDTPLKFNLPILCNISFWLILPESERILNVAKLPYTQSYDKGLTVNFWNSLTVEFKDIRERLCQKLGIELTSSVQVYITKLKELNTKLNNPPVNKELAYLLILLTSSIIGKDHTIENFPVAIMQRWTSFCGITGIGLNVTEKDLRITTKNKIDILSKLRVFSDTFKTVYFPFLKAFITATPSNPTLGALLSQIRLIWTGGRMTKILEIERLILPELQNPNFFEECPSLINELKMFDDNIKNERKILGKMFEYARVFNNNACSTLELKNYKTLSALINDLILASETKNQFITKLPSTNLISLPIPGLKAIVKKFQEKK